LGAYAYLGRRDGRAYLWSHSSSIPLSLLTGMWSQGIWLKRIIHVDLAELDPAFRQSLPDTRMAGLRGVVRVDGEPLRERMVYAFRFEEGETEPGLRIPGLPGRVLERDDDGTRWGATLGEAVTDDMGRFVMPYLSPGEYALYWQNDDGMPRTIPCAEHVVLPDGGLVEQDFHARTGDVGPADGWR